MTLRADHAAGLRIEPRRPHDRAIAAGTVAAAVPLDVCTARPMTALARRSKVGPVRLVRLRRGNVVVVLLADVAPETVLVPLLDGRLVVFVRPDDFHVVEPDPPLHIPAGGEHDDAAFFDRRQVVLDAAAAECVLDSMFARAAD